MADFIQFVIKHWELWLALSIVVLLILRLELRATVRGVHMLTAEQVVHMMNQEEAVVVDLRSQTEFDKGHIISAIHVPFSELAQSIKKLAKYKLRPVILLANNQQALQAGMLLKKQEFSYLAVLKGGMATWLTANLPIKKKTG